MRRQAAVSAADCRLHDATAMRLAAPATSPPTPKYAGARALRLVGSADRSPRRASGSPPTRFATLPTSRAARRVDAVELATPRRFTPGRARLLRSGARWSRTDKATGTRRASDRAARAGGSQVGHLEDQTVIVACSASSRIRVHRIQPAWPQAARDRRIGVPSQIMTSPDRASSPPIARSTRGTPVFTRNRIANARIRSPGASRLPRSASAQRSASSASSRRMPTSRSTCSRNS